MQEKRDLERKAGTGDIRMEEPAMDILGASQFKHSMPAYQVMAEQSNV